MKIYTSYFANIRNLEKENIFPIGICCFPPKFFTGPNLASLAPTQDILLNCKSNHTLYEQRYRNEVLSIHKDINTLLERIEYISDGKDVALCCYEKPTDFCHRHIIANWLKEKANIDVEEYKKTEETKINPLF